MVRWVVTHHTYVYNKSLLGCIQANKTHLVLTHSRRQTHLENWIWSFQSIWHEKLFFPQTTIGGRKCVCCVKFFNIAQHSSEFLSSKLLETYFICLSSFMVVFFDTLLISYELCFSQSFLKPTSYHLSWWCFWYFITYLIWIVFQYGQSSNTMDCLLSQQMQYEWVYISSYLQNDGIKE